MISVPQEPPPGVATRAPSMPDVPPALTLETLYAEHAAFVWRSIRRLGVPPESVDDAVQDVFLVVHRRLGEFEGRSSVRTWLFGIVRRIVRDHRPSRRQEPTDALVLDSLPGALDAGPLALAERAQAARAMQCLLDTLDDDSREAFILVELEEMSVPEAARALSANVNTVYSRVRAARRDLEQALGRARARRKRSEPWND
jgi:RNA polymerase sigma-70 factor (ECF subfamily)